jgi:hypothetical protein
LMVAPFDADDETICRSVAAAAGGAARTGPKIFRPNSLPLHRAAKQSQTQMRDR